MARCRARPRRAGAHPDARGSQQGAGDPVQSRAGRLARRRHQLGSGLGEGRLHRRQPPASRQRSLDHWIGACRCGNGPRPARRARQRRAFHSRRAEPTPARGRVRLAPGKPRPHRHVRPQLRRAHHPGDRRPALSRDRHNRRSPSQGRDRVQPVAADAGIRRRGVRGHRDPLLLDHRHRGRRADHAEHHSQGSRTSVPGHAARGKYLLVLGRANHMVFNAQDGLRGPASTATPHVRDTVMAATTLFWRATLRDDAAAGTALAPLGATLPSEDRFEYK